MPGNALGCCEPCHRQIESYRTDALDKGWLVRQGHAPGEAPVLYRGSRWALLRDDGSIEYQNQTIEGMK
jgi:5-methylcytosine-specific restriction protein A